MHSDTNSFLEREKERRRQADTIYKEYIDGKIDLNEEDLFHLAMIYQHGQNSDDYKIALNLAKESASRGYKGGKWLFAAATDRYLVSLGKKQIYGTQFKTDGTGYYGELEDDNVSGITDETRETLFVPKRSDQLKEFNSRNKPKSIS